MIPSLKRKHAARRQAIMAAGLLLAASAPRAELAGRFFFAPQERAALDTLRNTGIAPEASATSDPITVNGLVSRSGGKNTIWINGAPQYESDFPRPIATTKKNTPSGEVTIKLPNSNRTHPLKVGQTLTPDDGEVREGYQPSPPSDTAPGTPSGAAPGGPDNPNK